MNSLGKSVFTVAFGLVIGIFVAIVVPYFFKIKRDVGAERQKESALQVIPEKSNIIAQPSYNLEKMFENDNTTFWKFNPTKVTTVIYGRNKWNGNIDIIQLREIE